MVEALTRTTNNKALADLFAETLLGGSPMAQSVYGDFIGQLSARAPDRVEAFEDVVKDALSEAFETADDKEAKAILEGLRSGNVEISPSMSGLLKAAGFGGLLPKGYAGSLAFKRERIAREINKARKDGNSSLLLDFAEKNLDKYPDFVVNVWEIIMRGPPKSPK